MSFVFSKTTMTLERCFLIEIKIKRGFLFFEDGALRRFEYLNAFNRNKIGTLVDFEIDGFDMKKHSAYNCSLGGSRSELVDDEAPKLYDLFGVTNHFGRMGYGHYTGKKALLRLATNRSC